MAEQSTFIKLDRNIERWRWFKNKNTLIVFLWLLLNANVSDHEFEHEIIHRGEVATSLRNVSMTTGLTIREVRTAFLHLKSTGEVTSRSCNRYQVISIVNYDKYQDNRQAERQTNRQASDKQATSKRQQYKNIKNDKNEKNIKEGRFAPDSPSGEIYTSHLRLKPDEGTVEDIPEMYRDMFDNFADYWRYRNQ